MLKVLIVDDEQIVRVYLKSMLDWEQEGFSIIGTCKNGEEALRFMENNLPDIILTDLKMPKMTGLELIDEMKKRSYPTKVIVLSNHDDYELVRQAMKLGAMDYYLKITLQSDELLIALQNIKKSIYEERKLKTSRQIEQENNIENFNLARRSFLTTLFRGDIYYSELEISVYAKKYQLFKNPIYGYQLRVSQENRIEQLNYLNSIIYETFETIEIDIIHLSQTDVLVLMYIQMEDQVVLLEQLKNRAVKNIQSYLNREVKILNEFVIKQLDELLTCANPLLTTTEVEEISEPSPIISEKVADKYRQEIRAVLNFIHDNYQDRITLQDLADYVSLNEAYLSRLFKSETGRTLNHYLNEIRIYQAKELLKERDLMVKEVAQLVGIKDQLYFNRVFKKFYGASPTEYKESVKKVHC
ncbi:MAG: response regulator transcription factor [Turicibacter sp.]